MIRVKRLYRYMLRSYVPLLLMTFFICLFIVLMQFLWRYIDDLVGKGLSIDVIGELFFYAALTMVPMALPLAILLASLMIFGNLGEKFELTAMKASGISLLKVMSPLIILISFIAVGAFFFQNNVLPVAQTKMWTLLYSMRQKSPELEIPQGVFYTQIPGYNFYVESKDRDSGTLFNMMIYDVSRGFDNARVILADSGHLKSADDKAHLFLQLYNGEQFENLPQNGAYSQSSQPYRSENFDLKEILLAFDANFTRMDEAGMRNQYVGKNMTQLQATIDSVGLRVDSIGAVYAKEIKERPYINVTPVSTVRSLNGKEQEVRIPYPAASVRSYNIDSVFYADLHRTRNYLTGAIGRVQTIKQEYEFRSFVMEEDRATIRRHGIEMHRKFTLSFACLVFFFIGAPLGAIIRKGGIGTPLVISVLLFIFYYIIDNTGFKFARDGKMAVWEGVWLSSFVLLPLGVFLTYKAMRDSAVLNGDAYKNFFRRLRPRLQRRELELKQYAMEDVTPARAMASLRPMLDACNEVKEQWDALPLYRKAFYTIWRFKPFDMLAERMNSLIDFLANSKNPHTIQLINNYPYKVSRRTLPVITETTRSLIDLCNNLSKNE